MKRVVVIGGGITGLTAAYRLKSLACAAGVSLDVLLLEASGRLGGKILTERLESQGPNCGQWTVECGPDSFITQKPHALSLIRELGLESRLIAANRKDTTVFVYARGRLRAMPEGMMLMAPVRLLPFLGCDLISWLGKLRMGMELFLPGREFDDESMASFARRRFGEEALETLVQPIMAGICGGDAEQLSLKSTFPRFVEMERRQRSVIGALRSMKRPPGPPSATTMFMTLAGGLCELTQALAARIGSDSIRVAAPVAGVHPTPAAGRAWRVELEGGEVLDCDGVILAAPARVAAPMIRSAHGSLADALASIPFRSSATVSLAYDAGQKPSWPAGFGFVVARPEIKTISAATFTSMKFPERASPATSLLRCFIAGVGTESVLEQDDLSVLRAVRADLKRILGVDLPPAAMRLTRWPNANAQYIVGHERLLTQIDSLLRRLPGLWLAGASYRGAGIPDCIASGSSAAQEAFAHLGLA